MAKECPNCHSKRNWKDGTREVNRGSVQRFLCRNCGLRFSEKSYKESETDSDRQLCVTLQGAKKLDAATETKTVAGEFGKKKPLPNEAEGLTAQYYAYLEKEGYPEGTQYPTKIHRLIRLGADLRDPENVKTKIGGLKKNNGERVKDGTKIQYVAAYDALTKMLKIAWEKPKYTQEEANPYFPSEKQLDDIIAACQSKRMTTYLQGLKETFCDPSELLKLPWHDISGNTISINYPVKGHRPRRLEVSNKLIAMLNDLPRNGERVFPTTYRNMFTCYSYVRKRAAENQKDPDILRVELRSFRHWGGTRIAQMTNGNVLTVMKKLGLKRSENAMKYIDTTQNFEERDYEVTAATDVEEAKKAIIAGFEYVCEKQGIMLFRKLKRL